MVSQKVIRSGNSPAHRRHNNASQVSPALQVDSCVGVLALLDASLRQLSVEQALVTPAVFATLRERLISKRHGMSNEQKAVGAELLIDLVFLLSRHITILRQYSSWPTTKLNKNQKFQHAKR